MHPLPDGAQAFIHELADTARTVILPRWRSGLAVDTKADSSPVTDADREAELRMRDRITDRYPTHGIAGEEFGTAAPDAEWSWSLDPIDGTKSFVSGTPLFGTLIALCHGGAPVLGVIDLPALDQRFFGDGSSTTCNGTPVRARQVTSLRDAVVLATDHADVARHRHVPGFDRLVRSARWYRTWGDCYGYTLLAAGYADIMIDPVLHPWDLMAVLPVVLGAGLAVSGFDHDDPIADMGLLCAHPALLPALRRELATP